MAEGDAESRHTRFIIVSNRAPVSFLRTESGELEYSRGAGGLVTALNAVSRGRGAVWIASASSEEDVRVAREQKGRPLTVEELSVTLVEHDPRSYDLMYNHLANPLLWFVQHGLYDLPYSPETGEEVRRAWEEGYIPVSRNFASAVEKTLESLGGGVEPIVLLHDYQLYSAPRFLRERLGYGPFVSLFVHIPWPEPDYWSVLPGYVRRGVLESLLECNVVAFHTRRYARNFIRTAQEVLGAEADEKAGFVRVNGREVWVCAYPISIDPSEFEELSRSEAVLYEAERIKELPGRLLLRVDRMDLSKNIVRGFHAYGRMLERYPQMRGQVTFLALLQPSRGGIAEYAAYAGEVEKAAGEVNETYGTDEWRPIVLFMEDNFQRSVAAYRHYDALLVNAVRDGMNLVAKEAAVVNGGEGVLILSESAGAHEELGEYAITVNPFDIDEQAEAIHEALTMPGDERRRRAQSLRSAVLDNTIEDWVEAQISDIEAYRR